MRLRPYRKHEDDERLLELAQSEAQGCAPFGRSSFDVHVFARQRLAQDLTRTAGSDAETIMVAIADNNSELLKLTNATTLSPDAHAESPNTESHYPGPSAGSSINSRIVGFIALRIQEDRLSGRPIGYIQHLCIDSRFEHAYIHSALLAEAEIWAQRVGVFKLVLDVPASDERTISMYEHRGFTISTVSMELPCANPEVK
ncbi:hypothetical protein KIM372_10010 [Bombiscardovia nodaiensis]|uniref:N-acetyltransferase domain-containing protein n=1 Tax=Bombiscardovia nodaiensis TaxID=2932181 RepID=A0ABN6SC65_9BIFI|nr:hypothetical protein KIM372_10010 [Bombiscardovia nodaiensis]